MDNIEKVVVLLTPSVYCHGESGVHAARFEKLGLSAYGNSEDEAMQTLKRLFNKFVRTYRASGQLEIRLKQANVEWYLASKFEGEYEDTSETLPKRAGALNVSWTPVKDGTAALPVAA